MKKSPLFLYCIGTFLLIIFLAVGYWYSRHNLNFTCSSSTASFYTNKGNVPFLNYTQSVSFTHSGKAYVHISGNIHDAEKMYALNRTIIYSYERIAPTEYRMQVLTAFYAGSDSVPEAMEKKYLMPILPGIERIFGIRQLPTGDMVISNNSGPFLICAVH